MKPSNPLLEQADALAMHGLLEFQAKVLTCSKEIPWTIRVKGAIE